jgi:hypothetical protein
VSRNILRGLTLDGEIAIKNLGFWDDKPMVAFAHWHYVFGIYPAMNVAIMMQAK